MSHSENYVIKSPNGVVFGHRYDRLTKAIKDCPPNYSVYNLDGKRVFKNIVTDKGKEEEIMNNKKESNIAEFDNEKACKALYEFKLHLMEKREEAIKTLKDYSNLSLIDKFFLYKNYKNALNQLIDVNDVLLDLNFFENKNERNAENGK